MSTYNLQQPPHIGDDPDLLQLPTDRHRTARPTYERGMHTFDVPAWEEGESNQHLHTLSLFQVLLHRYSGQNEFVIGSLFLKSDMVHSFTIKTTCTPSSTYEQVEANVRHALDGRAEHLWEPAHSLQIQYVFADVQELAVRVEEFTCNELTLLVQPQAENCRCTFLYNAQLFHVETIERMTEHLLMLQHSLRHEVTCAIGALPILPEAEQRLLLEEWNGPALSYPEGACLHELLAAQASRTPDQAAVVCGEQSLTYRELDQRANQLAHRLLALGVKPEMFVGLITERSLEMAVAMIGVMKAGAAYVPLDPAYPRERLAYMLHDTEVPILLTQQHLLSKLPETDAQLLLLDQEWDSIATESVLAPKTSVTADNLAYVIYTSGSTGNPKGVLVEHKTLVPYVYSILDGLQLQKEDRVLQFAPITFDATVEELYPAWMVGATVVLRPNTLLAPNEEFTRYVEAQKLTVLSLPTAYWHEWAFELYQAGYEVPAHLRMVLLNAEEPSMERFQMWWQIGGDRVETINTYGPTETTVTASLYTPTLEDRERTRVPIGRPMAGVRLYVLDSLLQPVPIGVIGELHIGGIGPARGYLNLPDLTAEKFISDPLSDQPNARMYKTGDLVRYLPNGILEYCGRADHQVKIRGFRIELGEIEAVLAQHANVKETVVLAHSYTATDKRLVAYVIPQQSGSQPEGEWRAFLQEKLPAHMVPSAFVLLEAFPLTPNGKVDKKALPIPELSLRERTAEAVAPRTGEEELLLHIYEQVLNVAGLGVHDHFFEWGGHSLLATQVISRVREAFGKELPLAQLFAAPTVAELAIALQQTNATPIELPPLEKTRGARTAPMSSAQQRLWFLDRLEPESAAYNIPTALRLLGDLEPIAMERAVQEIVVRHEALRTTFAEENGLPVQIVHDHLQAQWSYVDLSNATDVQQAATEWMHQAAAEPFDLTSGPLLRAHLIRLEATHHVLFLNIHHIVSDGWSLGVLTRELTTLYGAFQQQTPVPLAELAVQYGDYARWQQRWMESELLENQLFYWKQKLGENLPVLQVPTDQPRPTHRSEQGRIQKKLLSTSVLESLERLSLREGATLYMTMLAAFKALLYRYTGQEDILVGTPVAGRTRRETEDLIGFFVNTLVLRSTVHGEMTFQDLLQEVRTVSLEAFSNQDIPFEKVVEEVAPNRDGSHSPLFQTMFVFENTSLVPVESGGLTLQPFDIHNGTAKFDLTVEFVEEVGGLSVSLEYKTDLFSDELIERMLNHFFNLLTNLAQNAAEPLSQLPMLSVAERQQLVEVWSGTKTSYPRQATVAELFETQVAETPDAIALLAGTDQLTYRELNAQANRLAHRLLQEGVRPQDRIGLMLTRSIHAVVAMLATLKTGAIYVPLDPAYPSDRLRFMVEDAEVNLLLTEEQWSSQLPESKARVLFLDQEQTAIEQESDENLTSSSTPDQLAYIIFTSGSTGRPKGVTVPHRGIVRLVKDTNYISISPEQVFLQFAPISFDAATFEVWGALLNGAQLVLYTEPVPDLTELGRLLRAHQVTTLWLTAGLFHQMVDERLEDLETLTHLLAGGDVLSVLHVKKVLQSLPNLTLINGYGPTENTTFTCCYPITQLEQVGSSVSIGRPIANTSVYVLDTHFNPVPVGVPGELYIGGDGLATGYLHRPELTAETFLANPFTAAADDKLYKTGDLVRWLADGTLEFLGRIDGQVKINGFRIELGEIETAIGEHPSVETNVVLARGEGTHKRLVAYVVYQPGLAPLDSVEWRKHLATRLPEYMMPTAYLALDALPLNPNGKVDKRALPEPDLQALLEPKQYVAARTPLEETLVSIWKDVLHVEQVGIHDNFFDLGGHSLLAMQIISRLRDRMEADVPLRLLFEATTVAEQAERLQELPASSGQTQPILPISRDGQLPASYAQQRLWFLAQWEPNSALYNIPIGWRITGELDEELLERALRMIVQRHETLRTTFVEIDGQPMQVIHEALDWILRRVDLTGLPLAEREEEALRLAQEDASQPFDLVSGPLFRMTLLKLEQNDHLFLVNQHHIISDGWSLGIFSNELSALYRALAANLPSPLSALPVQYADYAAWQKNRLQGAVLNHQMAYWRDQLGGERPLLQLPTDHPRQPQQTYAGGLVTTHLSAEISDKIRDLGAQEGATLYMTLLAAFKTLLYRYTGQADLLVGTPVAGRNRQEIEGLIGFFVNTLVLRSDLSGQPTFQSLLQRIKQTTLEAYAHQDLPFEKLVEELQPERDLSHSPLFQVLFAVEPAGIQSIEVAGQTWQALDVENDTAKFELSCIVQEEQNHLVLAVEYNRDLFEHSTIQRLTEHFNQLLHSIVEAPDLPITRLELLPAHEKWLVEQEWNRTATPYPREQSIHQLFEQQVEQTPDAVALRMGEEVLTYRELNQKANQVAHVLKRHGIGTDVLVGMCMERSLEMIIGQLAILKAGGAYVPLDPNYPADRLTFMLDDTQIPVLLTQERLVAKLPPHHAEVLRLDTEWEAKIAGESSDNLPSDTQPEDLAYVIYTSGSTGRPKGVCVPHQGVVRLVKNTNYLSFTPDEVFLQFAPISFDAATFEIWGSLLNGAQLVVMAAEMPTLAELGQTLAREQVTAIFLTSALFNQMVEHHMADLASVRQLLVGGEVMSPPHSKQALQHLTNCRLTNIYGPTENTTFTCFYPLSTEHVPSPIPIGKSISNTQMYVLDSHQNLCPIGVPGELHIGGDGLARHYLKRPDLNAEKFVPNPYGGDGECLYKTGDLVRWLPDGNLEFLGRLDGQVKIRGFRIELGEIETTIGLHPAVRDNIVLVREDQPGQKQLVAYVAPHSEEEVTPTRLRHYLQERLPEYMVPVAIVLLAELPINHNGKVDRRALPAPDLAQTSSEQPYTAPRTWTEELVANIWSQVLGVEAMGIHDNFFERGGHSLVAMQVMSRLRDALQTEVTLRQLFEAPTVAEFAKRVEASARTSQNQRPLHRVSRTQELPLSFAQQRLWIVDLLEPGNSTYNVPIALQIDSEVDVLTLEKSIAEIVRRHEALRTTFEVLNGEPVQRVHPAEEFALRTVDLQLLTPDERDAQTDLFLQEEAQHRFDLKKGPLFRTHLLRLEESKSLLVWNMHHIISDGWSLGVLMQELSTLYEAYSQGLPSPLPDLTVQYADFAVWQREWLHDEMDGQLEYWKHQLEGHQPVLQLPTDRPRPIKQTYSGGDQSLQLDPELLRALRKLSQQEGSTLFMTLLTAFNVLLHRYSGQDDLLVGTPIAGRNRSEVEGLIGFFVNTLVLRTKVSADMTFCDLLKQVQNTTLGAYAHQDLPFEKLVEELHPERDMSRSPLFQVMFSLETFHLHEDEESRLPLRALQVENKTAKFDLMLIMSEESEGLTASFNYNTDLFDDATITRMMQHFATLLTEIALHPQRAITELPLLPEAEQSQLLHEWNNTRTEYPNQSVQELFEQQVASTPDAIALLFAGGQLTYRALNERANQLAHVLQARGVGRDVLVGLCMERSPEMIISLLAILKAGGAYVPLDANYPAERLTFMLEDTEVPILLTQAHLRESLPPHGADVICLDTEWDAKIAPAATTNLHHTNRITDLAYVNFTSGSTGRPKGVCVTHQGVVRLVKNTNYVVFAPEEVFLQFAPISFDAATFEIWGSLLNGAKLAVFPAHTPSLADLGKALVDYQVSTMFLTTALFNQMVEHHLDEMKSIRQLLTGGEVMSVPHMKLALEKLGQCSISNVYGPTESTTFTSYYPIASAESLPSPVPIGKPISNTQMYVLDANLNLCPIGVPGELHIGGDGLARCYLNRPDLTEEKFVQNPFGAVGERLYKTGDLVRLLTDGNVEFLGRLDGQVKIRGFRIELGEIEAVVGQHPDVRENVVILREDEPGQKRLVAYAVASDATDLTSLQLRQYLKEKLPEYMVPAVVMLLPELPINHNGKIDKRALPMPDGTRDVESRYLAPQTPLQRDVVDIWQLVLRMEPIGLEDNFFDLGGHSLLATQVISKLREVMQVEMPLRHLFEAPTVAEFAKRVEEVKQSSKLAGPSISAVSRDAYRKRGTTRTSRERE